MSARLEADTCFLQASSGQAQNDEPPGLAVFSAPRKAARGREKDTLFLCLGLRARQPLPAEQYGELIDLATQTFFAFPGSVTSALRQALTVVNQQLLTYNLQAASSSGGLPAQGGLICAVLRGEDFYAVQSGTGMGLVAHPHALERFPSLPSRSLGLSQSPDVQYFHSVMQAQDYFCLCNTVPEGWTEKTLLGLGGLTKLSAVIDRLKETTTSDFAALVGRLEPAGTVPASLPTRGEANVKPFSTLFRSRPGAATAASPMPSAAAVDQTLPEDVETAPIADLELEASAPLPIRPSAEPKPDLPPEPIPQSGTDWQNLIRRTEQVEQAGAPPSIPILAEEPAAPEPETFERRPPPLRRPLTSPPAEGGLQRAFRSFTRALAVTFSEGLYHLRTWLARILPDDMLQKDGLFTVPTSVQIGIALAIPVLIVGLAAARYIQRGQAELFDSTLQEAMLEVAAADIEPNPIQQRNHWNKALQWVEQARQLRPSDNTVATLWESTQSNLDRLDMVTRIDYQPLVANGLGRETNLKQIVLIGQDVFALDTAGNRIMHLARNTDGSYQLDTAFECAGGRMVGIHSIGTLVAMVYMPPPNPLPTKADAILTMDNAGRLLYCAPGQQPWTSFLAAPDMGWKNPVTLQLYGDRLYVLEPATNEIWQYQGNEEGTFPQDPAPYFSGAVYDLKSVVDFAIASGEVFLLRQDGRMMYCDRNFSQEQPKCVEVAKFLDPRPGRGPSDSLWDVTQPSRLIYNAPPEPSLYLLDSGNSGLYRLSLKLELVQFFRARQPLPGPITAVASDTARVFVSAGDNIYVANRP